MKIITDITEMQGFSLDRRAHGERIALVPTMGYLHDGHLSLLREGRKHGDVLVMSLFVNPMQFGPKEDLGRYPRDFERDRVLSESAGTDVLFCPDAALMYPASFRTAVEVAGLSDVLCGKTRPGHFRGVATVVLKLFNIVMPHTALFGEKDFQQLTIIKQMAEDLNMAVEIVGVPTVREPDGLAMSSRNTYLSEAQRAAAASISKGLRKAAAAFKEGEKDSASLMGIVRGEMASAGLREDYVDIVDERTLGTLPAASSHGRIVVAAYAGTTRLIDNISLKE
ncbi:MAG: pantoate--beta-alanine ligase [Deltaproteobacteria bacterium]|nr:pantoate--beta-alanine ligase [Deltaproteobacteria bacterium]MCL5277267.1 pantoate--beta-alanine ligase [Deltaproteobacteria bacterium]